MSKATGVDPGSDVALNWMLHAAPPFVGQWMIVFPNAYFPAAEIDKDEACSAEIKEWNNDEWPEADIWHVPLFGHVITILPIEESPLPVTVNEMDFDASITLP